MIARASSLIAYVVVPIVGILLLDWDWRSIILLYWLENVTVGVRNVISMIRSKTQPEPHVSGFTVNGVAPTGKAAKPALILFFTAHYGIFTAVHGVFVMLIVFGGLLTGFGRGGPAPEPINFGQILILWIIASIVQIVFEFLRPRDTLPSASAMFWSPYSRIFVLHITIIVGAWIITAFNWPPIAAMLLVALHFVADLVRPADPSATGAFKPQLRNS